MDCTRNRFLLAHMIRQANATLYVFDNRVL